MFWAKTRAKSDVWCVQMCDPPLDLDLHVCVCLLHGAPVHISSCQYGWAFIGGAINHRCWPRPSGWAWGAWSGGLEMSSGCLERPFNSELNLLHLWVMHRASLPRCCWDGNGTVWQVVCRFRLWKKFKSSLGGSCASLQAAPEVNHSDGTDIKDTVGADRDRAVIASWLLSTVPSCGLCLWMWIWTNRRKQSRRRQLVTSLCLLVWLTFKLIYVVRHAAERSTYCLQQQRRCWPLNVTVMCSVSELMVGNETSLSFQCSPNCVAYCNWVIS